MATIRRDIGAGHHIIFDDTLVDDPNESLFDPDLLQAQNKIIGKAKGRGTTLFITHEVHRWVLRHFVRGGLVGKLLSDQYFFMGVENSRPFQEFRLLRYMREKDLRVPEPVAARIYRMGAIYRGDLITKAIPHSRDLHHILCESALSADDWRSVGKAIATMHNCQVHHHDANIRNIIVDSKRNIWLIDFDRCRERDGDGWKQSNVDRLLRSLHKEKGKNPVFHWCEEDWQYCLEGYSSERSA